VEICVSYSGSVPVDYSIWISEQIRDLGHEVIVANVRELRAISHSDRKSDSVDAEKLARYTRLDPEILRPIVALSPLLHQIGDMTVNIKEYDRALKKLTETEYLRRGLFVCREATQSTEIAQFFDPFVENTNLLFISCKYARYNMAFSLATFPLTGVQLAILEPIVGPPQKATWKIVGKETFHG
jgi:hypothetical protein